MGGRGFAPKAPAQRRNRTVPRRGEWQATPGVGWQHGPIPEPPDGLLAASRDAWMTWLRAWFAAHWTPADVPGLVITIQLFDQVERGKFQRAGELRLWLNGYGITPQGQQDRRWARPVEPPEPAGRPRDPGTRYDHLRALPEKGVCPARRQLPPGR